MIVWSQMNLFSCFLVALTLDHICCSHLPGVYKLSSQVGVAVFSIQHLSVTLIVET